MLVVASCVVAVFAFDLDSGVRGWEAEAWAVHKSFLGLVEQLYVVSVHNSGIS